MESNNTKGMIKVNILYPNAEGKTFDVDYYVNKHMALVKSLAGDALKGVSVDKGLAGGAPDAPLPYLAVGYLYFASVNAFQEFIGKNIGQIMADVPNYTNTEPEILISEVIL